MKKILVMLFFLFMSTTVYGAVIDINYDGMSCNTKPTDGGIYEGACFDAETDRHYIRCSLTTKPSGANYFETTTQAGDLSALMWFFRGDCDGQGYTVGTTGTIYLGVFVRFERINGLDVWSDTGSALDDFDKLIEMTGTNFRWGMYSGWPQGKYTGTDHKFTIAHPWYGSNSGMPNGTCDDSDGAYDDNIAFNVSPYSTSNPYLCDYGKWYAVVLAITPRTNNTGSVEAWINGTKVVSKINCVSSEVGATIDRIVIHGTIGQPGYDAPPHKRQIDHVIITTLLSDITNAGLMSDPEGGGDVTAPVVAITTIDGSSNTSATYATSSSTVTLAGTAYDAVGVIVDGVTWANSAGGSGTATCATCDGTAGTKNWNRDNIALQPGVNTITITGRDAANIDGTDILTVTYTSTDTEPPVLSALLPTGSQTCTGAGVANIALSLTTHEAATCKMISAADGGTTTTAYASMTDTFTTTGGTSHSATKTGLACGQTIYTYYVRCSDASGNPNTSSETISFWITKPGVAGGITIGEGVAFQ